MLGINNKVAKNLNKELNSASKGISDNFVVMERHLIQVQENQVEFEKYLTKILDEIKYIKDGMDKKGN